MREPKIHPSHMVWSFPVCHEHRAQFKKEQVLETDSRITAFLDPKIGRNTEAISDKMAHNSKTTPHHTTFKHTKSPLTNFENLCGWRCRGASRGREWRLRSSCRKNLSWSNCPGVGHTFSSCSPFNFLSPIIQAVKIHLSTLSASVRLFTAHWSSHTPTRPWSWTLLCAFHQKECVGNAYRAKNQKKRGHIKMPQEIRKMACDQLTTARNSRIAQGQIKAILPSCSLHWRLGPGASGMYTLIYPAHTHQVPAHTPSTGTLPGSLARPEAWSPPTSRTGTCRIDRRVTTSLTGYLSQEHLKCQRSGQLSA